MNALRELLTDPTCQKLSSARTAGFALVLAGIAHAFIRPDATLTTVELLGAGLVALGIRRRTPDPD